MVTTSFFYEVKLERTKQNVKRWISSLAIKGNPIFGYKVILTIVELKIRSSSSMQDPSFFEFQESVENSKVPFVGTIKVAILSRICV
jgi:hypothetical protein